MCVLFYFMYNYKLIKQLFHLNSFISIIEKNICIRKIHKHFCMKFILQNILDTKFKYLKISVLILFPLDLPDIVLICNLNLFFTS